MGSVCTGEAGAGHCLMWLLMQGPPGPVGPAGIKGAKVSLGHPLHAARAHLRRRCLCSGLFYSQSWVPCRLWGTALLPSLLCPVLPVSPETSPTWRMCHIGTAYILQPRVPRLRSQEPLNLLSLLCRGSLVRPVQPCPPSCKMGTLRWFVCPGQLERRETLGPPASGCLGNR